VEPKHLSRLLTLGCCAVLGASCDMQASDDAPEIEERDLVGDYCSYAATSTAQLVECAEHVRPRQVLNSNTNAGRYARGELDRCLADAGLFCRPR
jgi:hypothetical protein